MVDMLQVLTVPSNFVFYTISSIVPFSDMLIYESLATNNLSLAAAGNFLLLPNVEFIVTTALLIVTLLLLVGRIRSYFHAQPGSILEPYSQFCFLQQSVLSHLIAFINWILRNFSA